MGYIIGFTFGFALMSILLLGIFSFSMMLDAKWALYLNTYFKDTKLAIKSRNILYKCNHDDCKRMYRNYQIDLLKAVKGEKLTCPHCGRTVKNPRNVWTIVDKHTRVPSEDKWMASHIDCPKISISGYFKIRKLIKNAERLKKEEAVQQRFEEYNELEPNMDWIRNLQKK